MVIIIILSLVSYLIAVMNLPVNFAKIDFASFLGGYLANYKDLSVYFDNFCVVMIKFIFQTNLYEITESLRFYGIR